MAYTNPNDTGSLPDSDASMVGGTNGAVASTSMAAMERGFSLPSYPDENLWTPFSKQDGGFAGRPSGWAR